MIQRDVLPDPLQASMINPGDEMKAVHHVECRFLFKDKSARVEATRMIMVTIC